MVVRIGVDPVGWSNDDIRDLGATVPLETCLSETSEIGFEGVELGHKFPREREALRAVLRNHHLDLVSGRYAVELVRRSAADEIKRIASHLGLLQALGCKVVIVTETANAIHADRAKPLSERPRLRASEWSEFGRRISVLGDAILAKGMRLVYRHHVGTIVETEGDIDAFMDATGSSVHLLLDTGQAVFGGADPALLARRYRGRIGHFHAGDVRRDVMEHARRDRLSYPDAVMAGVFTAPGEGCVDFPAVLRALSGYSGWAVVAVEQDPARADPFACARKGYGNLRGFLAQSRLL